MLRVWGNVYFHLFFVQGSINQFSQFGGEYSSDYEHTHTHTHTHTHSGLATSLLDNSSSAQDEIHAESLYEIAKPLEISSMSIEAYLHK